MKVVIEKKKLYCEGNVKLPDNNLQHWSLKILTELQIVLRNKEM